MLVAVFKLLHIYFNAFSVLTVVLFMLLLLLLEWWVIREEAVSSWMN